MTSLFKPIKLILECYYMSNGLIFAIINIGYDLRTLGYDLKITCAKIQGNRLTEKSTKTMRYRITKMNVAQGI